MITGIRLKKKRSIRLQNHFTFQRKTLICYLIWQETTRRILYLRIWLTISWKMIKLVWHYELHVILVLGKKNGRKSFGSLKEMTIIKKETTNLIYQSYSYEQLEAFAEELNKKYDPRRLTQPRDVDVFDIVDMLGARIAIDYLSPDRSYLGATTFIDGSLWIWPGNPFTKDMLPMKKVLSCRDNNHRC